GARCVVVDHGDSKWCDACTLGRILCTFRLCFFSSDWYRAPPDLHSFPTRRSSDLIYRAEKRDSKALIDQALAIAPKDNAVLLEADRKSTRLNSSHSQISYAVFCLKKKNHRDSLLSTSLTTDQAAGGLNPACDRCPP